MKRSEDLLNPNGRLLKGNFPSCGWTELLADEATGNHRGASLDGRPRLGEMIGPMAGHRVSQSAHPTKEGIMHKLRRQEIGHYQK